MGRNGRWRGGARVGGVLALVVAVFAAAVVVTLALRRDDGDGGGGDAAAEGARRFLDAWAADDLAAAAGLTDDPEAARSLLESVRENTRPERMEFALTGEPEPSEAAAEGDAEALVVPFTATFTLPGLGAWSYESTAPMRPGDGDGADWLVAWESALVHPELAEGQTLVLTTEEAERAPILAADGSPLAGPSAVWDIAVRPADLTEPAAAWAALEALDVGIDTDALADRVAAAEPEQAVAVVTLRDEVFQQHADALRAVPGLESVEGTRQLAHSARAVVGALDPETGAGVSGLQQRYDEQLSGAGSAAVVVADRASGAAVETLHAWEGGADGSPVETTIDPATQAAAEAALEDAGRAGAIVAIRPSTGHVLAAADWPLDGFDRSLRGQLAPGSTFKVVTAAALLEGGATPDDVLGCPRTVTVDGQSFENQDEFELGPDTTLREAFAASCNTALIDHRDRFAPDTLSRTAEAFGIGGEWSVGAATFDGSVPVAESDNELAASLIGQARVQTSPLVMASVAATVAQGAFHQPVLVPAAVDEPHQASAELAPETFQALRSMMRETVTAGSAAALAGVPGEPHGKTGTAEFADEDGELSTNAWIIGFLGERDLAFAVVLEDGGSGGSDAGPVAADFLSAL
ncbi:penicillin-binding transpeptidase domain-containing protein [Streptomyces millisiae]|uniref:Penicillin-binding transpeptidase domain-containing protein n=1 Tax=Streptomyces millisiae TaxID=3075542 RepID=A0ABU2LN66_9ACTN|nr:penicillin-binding transpeptidase domain-containing protein [Streptomyces sp. DSM 44918]MDT0318723.1 penicillin-binding transpeptidase domain-containing protein [Streptomyces sp. DSM 44918]